jgi:hypothetical protein
MALRIGAAEYRPHGRCRAMTRKESRVARNCSGETMARFNAIVIALLLSIRALAGEAPAPRTVDLRAPHALEQLQRQNPAHFEKIREMLAGLETEPRRAESDWLQVTFGARDVDLSRHLIRTSNPPKQLLQFTLDDVRYTMYVVRSDMVGAVEPAKKPK